MRWWARKPVRPCSRCPLAHPPTILLGRQMPRVVLQHDDDAHLRRASQMIPALAAVRPSHRWCTRLQPLNSLPIPCAACQGTTPATEHTASLRACCAWSRRRPRGCHCGSCGEPSEHQAAPCVRIRFGSPGPVRTGAQPMQTALLTSEKMPKPANDDLLSPVKASQPCRKERTGVCSTG
jgi:hypothetical protein